MNLFDKHGKFHQNLIIIISSLWSKAVLECVTVTYGEVTKTTWFYTIEALERFKESYKILDRR